MGLRIRRHHSADKSNPGARHAVHAGVEYGSASARAPSSYTAATAAESTTAESTKAAKPPPPPTPPPPTAPSGVV